MSTSHVAFTISSSISTAAGNFLYSWDLENPDVKCFQKFLCVIRVNVWIWECLTWRTHSLMATLWPFVDLHGKRTWANLNLVCFFGGGKKNNNSRVVSQNLCDKKLSNVWSLPFCVTWLIHTCGMTHSYVWHDSFIRVIWPNQMSGATLLYSWYDSFIYVTRYLRFYMHDVTYPWKTPVSESHSGVCGCACICICVYMHTCARRMYLQMRESCVCVCVFCGTLDIFQLEPCESSGNLCIFWLVQLFCDFGTGLILRMS